MTSIRDYKASETIAKVREELKKIDSIKPPEWGKFVKTGAHKERTPVEKDWWYTRCASVLRRVCLYGPIGVSKLRVKYGGKKNRGHKPEKFYMGSGNILRKVLQQLEKAELVKYKKEGIRKGRIITSKGESLLNKAIKK